MHPVFFCIMCVCESVSCDVIMDDFEIEEAKKKKNDEG